MSPSTPVEAFSPCHGMCSSVHNQSFLKRKSSGKNVTLPAVFKALIRLDIVNYVHTNLHKTSRQPYTANELAVSSNHC